ncbi:Histidine kinase [Reichenbachiella faecimaris]|uniref:Histidine kinase n=1 Tax=Reichenbachiella faecimaris TaxID=692418 RepID=A0A1W2GHR4_REIFA|nr:histidine kinase [Reichenbachiella faecimaris]SMD35816.1 Histidine kinase [Reichenbachiella faecimaris]
MTPQKKPFISIREAIFQLILNAVVFVFYGYSRHNPQFEEYEYVFFLNYAAGALIINYWLLPSCIYTKKYLQFTLYFLLIVAAMVLIEEFILEKIYFPDTRGQRFIALGNLLNMFPTIGILSGFKFAWDALGKQKEVEELKDTVKESELQFLKSQINPHFLFNNLNNLYAHAIENSPQTPTIILELSAVMRYMLYDCQAKYVSLTKEVEHLSNFINLNNLQIEGRGRVNFDRPELTGDCRIAPLILIIFVENAFKHSSSSQTENIEIFIDLSVTAKGELHFTCTNSYLEQTNTQDINSGIGLENVQKRLQLLYPDSHTLNITKTENEYQVNLKMNLDK